MNAFDRLPKIYPLTTQEEMDNLMVAAGQDAHWVVYPTHYVKKQDEIVGYFSVCKLPVVCLWMHTGKVKPLDSVIALNTAENLVRSAGHKHLFALVSEESPYAPVLEEHMSLKPLHKAVVWGKQL
jgi:hypothetical protein